MDPADIDLRHATYRRFVGLGRAPTAAEVAAATRLSETAVRTAWQRPHTRDQNQAILNRLGLTGPFWRLG